MLEDDCRYLMVSKIPMVGISLKAQTDINGLLEGGLLN
jgi:hypothetical protein